MNKEKRIELRDRLLRIVGEFRDEQPARVIAEAVLEIIDGPEVRPIERETGERFIELIEELKLRQLRIDQHRTAGLLAKALERIDTLEANPTGHRRVIELLEDHRALSGRVQAHGVQIDKLEAEHGGHEARISNLAMDLTKAEGAIKALEKWSKHTAHVEDAMNKRLETLERNATEDRRAINEQAKRLRVPEALATDGFEPQIAALIDMIKSNHGIDFVGSPLLKLAEQLQVLRGRHAAFVLRTEARIEEQRETREMVQVLEHEANATLRAHSDRIAQLEEGARVGELRTFPECIVDELAHTKVRPNHAEQRHGDPTTQALEQLTRERDEYRSRFQREQYEHSATLAERDEARRALKCVKDEHDELQRRVDVDTGALRLANTEANRLRERVNPLIAPQFSGQDIADAIVNTVQMLEAQLASAKDGGKRAAAEAGDVRDQALTMGEELNRAIEDRDAYATKCAEATTRLGELQAKSTGHRSTIVDQAKQIRELRETLEQRNREHAAALARQASTWEHDRRDGAEQVRRLVEENQKLRAQSGTMWPKAERDKAMATIADLQLERDNAWRCLDHRVDGQPFYSEMDRPLADMITEVLGHYRREIEALGTFCQVPQRDVLQRVRDYVGELRRDVQNLGEIARVADADRIPLRMDLDTANAHLAERTAEADRMRPLVNSARLLAALLEGLNPNLFPIAARAPIDAFIGADDVYEQACAQAADAETERDDYAGSFCEAADNEGARIAAESRAEAESDPGNASG